MRAPVAIAFMPDEKRVVYVLCPALPDARAMDSAFSLKKQYVAV